MLIPIVCGERSIGILEAGVQRVGDQELRAMQDDLEKLVAGSAAKIARAHPNALLELIAARAMQVIGADAASIHVLKDDKLVLQAGAGAATHEFVRRFSPRPDGVGSRAVKEKRRQVLGPEEVRRANPALFDEGVRTLAAFPLDVLPNHAGILYVHYQHEQPLSEADCAVEQVFADQAQAAIRTYLLWQRNAFDARGAWQVAELLQHMQLLSSTSESLDDVLKDLGKEVMWTLDADAVVLCHYSEFMPEGIHQTRGIVVQVASGDGARLADAVKARLRVLIPHVRGQEHCVLVYRTDGGQQSELHAVLGHLLTLTGSVVIACLALGLKTLQGTGRNGFMLILHRRHEPLDAEHRRQLDAIGSSLSITLDTVRAGETRLKLSALAPADARLVQAAKMLDEASIPQILVDTAAGIVGAGTAAAWWIDPMTGRLQSQPRAVNGGGRPQRTSWQRDLAEQVRVRREPLLAIDDGAAAKTIESPHAGTDILVPLMGENGVAGVLAVSDPKAGVFAEEDLRVLTLLAFRGAVALSSVVLGERLKHELRARSPSAQRRDRPNAGCPPQSGHRAAAPSHEPDVPSGSRLQSRVCVPSRGFGRHAERPAWHRPVRQ
jgi:hypothetical protein